MITWIRTAKTLPGRLLEGVEFLDFSSVGELPYGLS
jgi:hypothetical protein